ncbi:hypothetical protein I5L01_15445, partial [Erythrobacter sp. YJ-T3-07]|nr:hypothetical protein [Erythrobacter sp. YJ-T3-07]
MKLPTAETNTAAASQAPVLKLESDVAKSSVKPQDIPLEPPAPDTTTTPVAPENSIAPEVSKDSVGPVESTVIPTGPTVAATGSPVVKKKGFLRRLRNLIITLTLLGGLAFGGGIWYSRINDNFNDFFSEYIPFGEQAVLYFEEKE